MGNASQYDCGGNLFWIDFAFSAVPTFVSQHAIEVLRLDYFSEPCAWPAELPVVVAVQPAWKAKDIQKHFGSLHRVSPEEIDAAFIKAVAEEIRAGAAEDTLKPLD